MAIKRCESSIDVVKAAKIRIRNVFQNGLPVYMSFSGGKDSLCMAQLVMELVQAGEINPALSTVQSKKTKAIEALSKYRIEKARLESESAGNDAVDDWIAAVLGEEVSEDE